MHEREFTVFFVFRDNEGIGQQSALVAAAIIATIMQWYARHSGTAGQHSAGILRSDKMSYHP